MKRFVWLLLALFCTALAQVQPVDVPLTKAKACCCGQACGCGMPGCGLPPAQAPLVFTAAQPAQVAGVSARREAQPRRRAAVPFYVSLVERVAAPAALSVSASVVSAAAVPLFKAHCSFLL